MDKTMIASKASGTLSKIALKLKKHSPEILVVAGVIGTVASAVMACKATTKINTLLEKTKEDVDIIHDTMENGTLMNGDPYTEDDGKKDLAVVYVQTGVNLVKLYAPSILLGALSLTSILASNNMLRKRNVALAAAYATVDQGFKEYRNRVVERFGQEVDRELKHNIKAKTFNETVTDENGKIKKSKVTVNVADPNEFSDYARVFERGNPCWESDPEMRMMFLRSEQNYANDRLKHRGYLFLNEVYDRLGFPQTKAGQIVGWVYKPEDPLGDNFIEFGMFETNREVGETYERVTMMDFNVDGNILDLIE